MNALPLDGKAVVIIGGTTGMGLSGARACVDAGAKVVVVGRDQGDAEAAGRGLGDAAWVMIGDATDSQTAQRAIDLAIRELGRFDGLYHVAGGSGRKAGDGPLESIPDEAWDFTLRLNLTSVFYSARAAVRQFRAQQTPGSVLLLSSILGISPSPKLFATHAYAAAKGAVFGFARSCASYYAPNSIRFNVLAPALVETPMSQRSIEDEPTMRYIATKQPLDGNAEGSGRVGQPQDLDAAVVYFLSDQSRFVTGQMLAIDGGWSVTEGRVD
jgi:NAD(P)-dependent dehydrogenase (short-subunit alcohol dehydrogenase family)